MTNRGERPLASGVLHRIGAVDDADPAAHRTLLDVRSFRGQLDHGGVRLAVVDDAALRRRALWTLGPR